MTKLFVIALTGLLSLTTFAADKFRCSNVGGTEEWTISVDLTAAKAGFFDNDAWVIIPLKSVNLLETFPGQKLYVFEGKDTSGIGKMQIYFNLNKSKASVIFNAGTPSSETSEALDGCIVDNSVEL